MPASIGPLIINSPYEEPSRHWTYDRETRSFDLKDGRRPAGYVRASESSKAFDDPGIFVPLELPNAIRPRVKAWREAGYPGVTGITRRLLEHWCDPSRRSYAFFFCQLEAIETLIWLAEAPPALRPSTLGVPATSTKSSTSFRAGFTTNCGRGGSSFATGIS